MQAWVMSCETAVRVFNGIFGWDHFPLVAAFGLPNPSRARRPQSPVSRA